MSSERLWLSAWNIGHWSWKKVSSPVFCHWFVFCGLFPSIILFIIVCYCLLTTVKHKKMAQQFQAHQLAFPSHPLDRLCRSGPFTDGQRVIWVFGSWIYRKNPTRRKPFCAAMWENRTGVLMVKWFFSLFWAVEPRHQIRSIRIVTSGSRKSWQFSWQIRLWEVQHQTVQWIMRLETNTPELLLDCCYARQTLWLWDCDRRSRPPRKSRWPHQMPWSLYRFPCCCLNGLHTVLIWRSYPNLMAEHDGILPRLFPGTLGRSLGVLASTGQIVFFLAFNPAEWRH